MSGTPRRSRSRKPSIRDHMDLILEAKGFYRKHVPRTENGDTLFRSIADALFGTQFYRFIVARAAELLQNEDSAFAIKYPLICLLAQRLKFEFEVVNSIDRELRSFSFSPIEDENVAIRPRYPKILFCHTPSNVFDPIYPSKMIDSAGICQSILYELLYVDVFQIQDAMLAAGTMLNGTFDPDEGKPEILNPDFEGSAMSVLENWLIPFPYKVAKCLDPSEYRNIEFDSHEMSELTLQKHKTNYKYPPKDFKEIEKLTIGNLPNGTPCVMKFDFGVVYGTVQGTTNDRRIMEVYVPLHDQCVFVDRSMILPIKNLPDDMKLLPRAPNGHPKFVSPRKKEEEPLMSIRDDVPRRNHNMVECSEDLKWIRQQNFSLPPPPSPILKENQDIKHQEETRHVIPPPLTLRQVNDMPDCCLPQNCLSCATGATIPVSSPGFAPGAVALSPVATTPGYLPGVVFSPTTVMGPVTPTILLPPRTPNSMPSIFPFPTTPVMTPMPAPMNPIGPVFIFPAPSVIRPPGP